VGITTQKDRRRSKDPQNQYVLSSGLDRLTKSVESRRVLLDKAHGQFEPLVLSGKRKLTELDHPGLTELNDKELNAAGRLSLGLALNLAQLTATPEIALGYLESIEALVFALIATPHLIDIQKDQKCQLGILIKDLPHPEDYELCATLVKAKLNKRKNEWQRSILVEDGLVNVKDFELAQSEVFTLHHAAGPDYTARRR